MNLKHYLIIFVLVAAAVFVKASIKVDTLETMDSRTSAYNETIDNAVDDSLSSMLEVTDSFSHTVNLEICSDTFFKSLYAGFGVIDSQTGQEQLKMYIPLLLVTDTDGFYIMYHTESSNGGQTSTSWTAKMPYYHSGSIRTGGSVPTIISYQINYTMEDTIQLTLTSSANPGKTYYFEGLKDTIVQENSGVDGIGVLQQFYSAAMASGQFLSSEKFDSFRKSVMIYQITKKMNYYVNEHNKLASDYGISYTFSLPESSMDSFARVIEDISLLAICQGYPYGKGTDDVYSRFSVSGARLYKATKYFIYKIGSITYYHRSMCSKLPSTGVLPEYRTREECAKLKAWPCPYCKP